MISNKSRKSYEDLTPQQQFCAKLFIVSCYIAFFGFIIFLGTTNG